MPRMEISTLIGPDWSQRHSSPWDFSLAATRFPSRPTRVISMPRSEIILKLLSLALIRASATQFFFSPFEIEAGEFCDGFVTPHPAARNWSISMPRSFRVGDIPVVSRLTPAGPPFARVCARCTLGRRQSAHSYRVQTIARTRNNAEPTNERWNRFFTFERHEARALTFHPLRVRLFPLAAHCLTIHIPRRL